MAKISGASCPYILYLKVGNYANGLWCQTLVGQICSEGAQTRLSYWEWCVNTEVCAKVVKSIHCSPIRATCRWG